MKTCPCFCPIQVCGFVNMASIWFGRPPQVPTLDRQATSCTPEIGADDQDQVNNIGRFLAARYLGKAANLACRMQGLCENKPPNRRLCLCLSVQAPCGGVEGLPHRKPDEKALEHPINPQGEFGR